jgi:hypothetical protein
MNELDDATKQALRLAAAGALLHNLGKINAKFLDKQINNANNNYLYQHILGLIAPHVSKLPAHWQGDPDARKLTAPAVLDSATLTALKTTFMLPYPFDDRTDYMIGDLIEYLGQGENWYSEDNGKYGIEHIFPGGSRLTHLMNRAHRGASGGEKENIATTQYPDAADLYLSTPFGYETAAPNINNIDDLLAKIEAKIQKHLASLENPLPLPKIVDDLHPLLSRAIADTQRPLNDVTVGDIGHTGMAFLLTQAVDWIHTKRNIDHAELAKTETDNTLYWRVLTIHTDGLRYLEEASTLVDLQVRQQQLQETFQTISQQLAETLLAVEIYADEQRRLFVFPNLVQDTEAYRVVERIVTNFNIDGLRLASCLSAPVTNHPNDKNGTYIGDQVLNQLQEMPPYDFDADAIAAFWPSQSPSKQLCTACNVRPQGYGAEQIEGYKHNSAYYRNKAEGRNICCICMDRRAGVAKKWTEGELKTTIWLDEVADDNGRLVLIVGHWSLEEFIKNHTYPQSNRCQSRRVWLHSIKFLNSPCPDHHAFTLNGQTYTWQVYQSALSGEQELVPLKQTKMTIHAPSLMNITVQDVEFSGNQLSLTLKEDLTSKFSVGTQVKCWGQDFVVKKPRLLETVSGAGRQKILSDVLWDQTYPFVVQRAKKANVLEITSPGEGAKNESFARLRRIWQTTRQFWQTVCPTDRNAGHGLQQSLMSQIVGQRSERLAITGALTPVEKEATLGHYHTYELKLTTSVKLSVVWDADNKRFITCDNLEYLARPELLGRPVLNLLPAEKEITVEEPTGYGSQNKTWGKIIIEQARVLENSSYAPTIPILAEPRTFMALAPADKALDVIDAIKIKYEREMGKVRNRLPLHLGAVYFHRRTPLRTALDAGRRMLQQKPLGGDAPWTVKQVHKGPLPTEAQKLAAGTQQFAVTIRVELEQAGRTLTWRVPAVMGDGATEDNWYPYVFIQNDVSGRQRIFKGCRPQANNVSAECWLVHAAELQPGDQVYFTPATVDFQWLDSAGQRFAIAYDDQGRRRNHPSRPYLLDDLATMQVLWELLASQNGLTSSQIYALRDLIEIKRESWQPTVEQCQQEGMFWQFCRNAVANADWKAEPTQEQMDQLAGWAISGLFADVIHLYMGIMKQKPRQEEQNHE